MELLNKDTYGKAKMLAITNDIVTAVESGHVNAVEAIVMLKTYSKAIEQAESILKPTVCDEISKYGKEGAKLLGCELSLVEAGTRFDYTNCGDYVLNCLYEEKKALDAKIKERETMLKAIPINGLEILEDGNVVGCIYPPQKSSSSTFKFSFSK